MSPLKAKVLINECVNTLSISVGKPILGPSRSLNVYLEGELSIIKTKVGEYIAIGLPSSYKLVRCVGDEAAPVAECLTLAACQAVALSDYIQQTGVELIPDEEYD